MTSTASHKLSVAPMMEWTDRHCRYFHRQISRGAMLYTEMVTAEAILHGDQQRLLAFTPDEKPLALQLGGSEPDRLAAATRIAATYDYDEINLNVGCPSDRVQTGRFGACLMKEPSRVRDCLQAMTESSASPVTVKCRIGVDDMDDDQGLATFVDTVKEAGISTFIIHARKAWLEGLSPRENREIPPLNYQRVYQLKASEPDLTVIINGGIETLAEAKSHLTHVDGVMIGRAAYHTPYMLAKADNEFFGFRQPVKTRTEIAEAMIPYIERELAQGTKLHHITRHMLGLFHGQPGARAYRRTLSEKANRPDADIRTYREALSNMVALTAIP